MPRLARIVAEGYPHHITQRGNYRQRVFQNDEDWEYNSMHDPKVCPICQEYDLIHMYKGNDMPANFPSKKWILSKGELQIIYPNVHDEHKEMSGPCRCYVTMLHPMETLTTRLADELNRMVG